VGDGAWVVEEAEKRFPSKRRDSACQAGALRLNLPAMKRRYAILSMIGFALLGACKAEKPETAEPAKAEEKSDAAAGNKVRLKTSKGDILIELNAEKAPITVKNFLKYVGDKHYDGTVFHRVIDGFMIQGGGMALDGGRLIEKRTGAGIKNESNNGLKNDTGTIAMARTPDPDSATAQFFINVEDNNGLNFPTGGGYAVFGKVIEGMEVVNAIKGVKTGAGDVPVEAVVIESATIVE
jgi:cyclophilin family peptidyl-prolyl cis-trans isomerase